MIDKEVTILLLAGGQSRRLGGGDKCLKILEKEVILDKILKKILPQNKSIILNANGDPNRFSKYSFPIVKDTIEGHLGPLVGVLSGMEWAKENQKNKKYIVSIATDTPFFPNNIVNKLYNTLKNRPEKIICASWQGRANPVFAIWPISLSHNLRADILSGARKIDSWTAKYGIYAVNFISPNDPFFNINTPEDLKLADQIMRAKK
ncbi:molybdenum cofactor guanylyltransferase MobA [Hyphomicrobiales bacterium]|nr:molybdenum cofactor guanylyltransferase MobA [Hyphomicrobiales bacterium]